MSVCGQTEEESGSEEPPGGGGALRDMYEQKAVSKVVRVLTVLAYLLSVSLAAILLSVYYVCVWQSPKLPPLNDTDDVHPGARRADPPTEHFDPASLPHYTNEPRGGHSTVSEATPPVELSSLPADSEPPDPAPPAHPAPPSHAPDTTALGDYNDTSPTPPTNDTRQPDDQRRPRR